MNFRRLTAADATLLPQLRSIFQAAVAAGTFTEWGGINDYSVTLLGLIVNDPNQRLFGAFDDTNVLRGVVHAAHVGTVDGSPLWEFICGIYDPTLTTLTFSRLYLGAVKAVAQAFPAITFVGKVVAGGTLDRLWQPRIGGFRQTGTITGRNGQQIAVAIYTVPADTIAAVL